MIQLVYILLKFGKIKHNNNYSRNNRTVKTIYELQNIVIDLVSTEWLAWWKCFKTFFLVNDTAGNKLERLSPLDI